MSDDRAPPPNPFARLKAAERALQRAFILGSTPEECRTVCDEWRAAVNAWWETKEGGRRDT